MTEIAVIFLFLCVFVAPFAVLLLLAGWHWLTDRAWRQW